MVFEVVFGLDIALASDFLKGYFFAIHLDVLTLLPVTDHGLQGALTDALTLTELTGFFAGEDFGQEVEQVLGPGTGGFHFATALLVFDGLTEEVHLAPQIVFQRPADEVFHGLVPLLAMGHIEDA